MQIAFMYTQAHPLSICTEASGRRAAADFEQIPGLFSSFLIPP